MHIYIYIYLTIWIYIDDRTYYGSLMYQYLYNIKHIFELTLDTEFSEVQCLRIIKVRVLFGALVSVRTSLTSKTFGFGKSNYFLISPQHRYKKP